MILTLQAVQLSTAHLRYPKGYKASITKIYLFFIFFGLQRQSAPM